MTTASASRVRVSVLPWYPAAMSIYERLNGPTSRYDSEKGERLAAAVAGGDSVAAVCARYDWMPSPVVVKRWRRDYPAFDDLMRDAESCRADLLEAQALTCVDDDKLTAAQAKARADVRLKLAERVHAGAKRDTVTKDDAPASSLTDAQLSAIIMGRLDDALRLAGGGERGAILEHDEGGSPPCTIDPPASEREPDYAHPAQNSGGHSVSTDETDSGEGGDPGLAPGESRTDSDSRTVIRPSETADSGVLIPEQEFTNRGGGGAGVDDGDWLDGVV